MKFRAGQVLKRVKPKNLSDIFIAKLLPEGKAMCEIAGSNFPFMVDLKSLESDIKDGYFRIDNSSKIRERLKIK